VDHIVSACPTLAQGQYVKRHDRVCTHLHCNICKEVGVKLDNKHWYDHVPKSVETSHYGKVTILWNQQVQTNRTIPSNKPDIIIHDNKQGTCMLINVAILGDRNMIKKEAAKILKYTDLTIEIQYMWNVKATVLTVITGATGTISKSLRQYLSNILGTHKIKELQKQLYWALHTYYKSANVTVQNILHRQNNITCRTSC